MDTGDVISAISAASALLALVVSFIAMSRTERLATSDFQARERVKLQTAELLAVLRGLMIKGVIYNQQDPQKRDDPAYGEFVNIDAERQAIGDFMRSATALAYHSFAARRSRLARENGVESEPWRIFFLRLGEMQHTTNPWIAAKRAAGIERQLDTVREKEIRAIARTLSDLPEAINSLFLERQHDVLFHVLVDRRVDEDVVSDEHFMPFVQFLREVKAMDDPELDLFWAASTGDVALLKTAHAKGANMRITTGQITARYSSQVPEFQSWWANPENRQKS